MTIYTQQITQYDENGNVDIDAYEKNLRQRQAEHLEKVSQNYRKNWQPCLHDSCPECLGTGIKKDGSACIHNLSCPCPKCSPYVYNKTI